MINLALSVAAAVAAFALCKLFGLPWLASLLPAFAALIGAYIFLARRSLKALEAVMATAQKELMARKVDRAVAALEAAFPLSRWQFLIAGQLHAQIGQLLYIQK